MNNLTQEFVDFIDDHEIVHAESLLITGTATSCAELALIKRGKDRHAVVVRYGDLFLAHKKSWRIKSRFFGLNQEKKNITRAQKLFTEVYLDLLNSRGWLDDQGNLKHDRNKAIAYVFQTYGLTDGPIV